MRWGKEGREEEGSWQWTRKGEEWKGWRKKGWIQVSYKHSI